MDWYEVKMELENILINLKNNKDSKEFSEEHFEKNVIFQLQKKEKILVFLNSYEQFLSHRFKIANYSYSISDSICMYYVKDKLKHRLYNLLISEKNLPTYVPWNDALNEHF